MGGTGEKGPRGTLGIALALLLIAVVVLAVNLAGLRPAVAHAQLESSEPAAGTTVQELHRVVLRFGEEVEASGSHLWIENETTATDLGAAHHPNGDHKALEVAVPALPSGRYILGFHIVASDGDPQVGGVPFTLDLAPASVGAPATAAKPPSEPGPAATATHRHGDDLPAGAARVLLDASLATLVGGLAFVATVWPAGAASRRTRRLLWGAALVAALASFVLAVVQHATATGLTIGQALEPSHLRDTMHYRFGRVAAARVVLLGVCALLMTRLRSLRQRSVGATALWTAATAVAFGLFETVVLLGHNSEVGGVAGWARLVHTVGISVWLGGLLVLFVVVLPRRRRDELLTVLPRFSRLASGAVGAVVLAGIALALDLVGGVAALPTTTYGRLLLLKLVVVGGLLAIASRSRKHVRGAMATSADDIARPLVTWVAIELGLMAAVFALTALLVSQAPPT
jgi:putative copper export protein/methionine-rich copper-binding protein CopC